MTEFTNFKLLSNDENDYLRMLAYEKSGYEVLIKEFTAENYPQAEFTLDEEKYGQLIDKYRQSNTKLILALEEIMGEYPKENYRIDFNERTLEW